MLDETYRLPNIMLFGEMTKKGPAHGPLDLKILGIDGWFELCQDRD